jgi:hypothetical protein
LGVSGAISGFFAGRSDNLSVRTAKKGIVFGRKLWFCQGISNYIAIILYCCIHIIVTVARRGKWVASNRFVVWPFEVHSGLDSPGLISRRIPGVLLLYGYSGWLYPWQKHEKWLCLLDSWTMKGIFKMHVVRPKHSKHCQIHVLMW